jgi:hypothetical protein
LRLRDHPPPASAQPIERAQAGQAGREARAVILSGTLRGVLSGGRALGASQPLAAVPTEPPGQAVTITDFTLTEAGA